MTTQPDEFLRPSPVRVLPANGDPAVRTPGHATTCQNRAMRLRDVELLFGYLYWLRDRVLDSASDIPLEALNARHQTARDLKSTLVHELDVEWSWRERLRGEPADSLAPERELKTDDFPTLDSLRERWHRDEQEMRAWLRSLSDEDLSAPPMQERARFPLWFYLMHILSHAMQQFSDAAVLLSTAGRSPGDLEFLSYADTLSDA